jgi:hypothetical protein
MNQITFGIQMKLEFKQAKLELESYPKEIYTWFKAPSTNLRNG